MTLNDGSGIFPKEMMKSELSLEDVASKLTYFQLQLQLIHWQTTSFSQHKALDKLHSFVLDFKDEVMEKLMGYANTRVRAFAIPSLDKSSSEELVSSIISFAYTLEKWAESKQYCDIENLAQSLSGAAAQTKYLLTLK